MATIVGTLLPWLDRGFRSLVDDQPLVGGWIELFENGVPSTHKNAFSQADLDPVSVLPNPMQLDSTGRITAFLEPGLYDATVRDSALNLLYTVEGINGGTAAPDTPTAVPLDTSGARNAVSGYTILDSDHLVTINETVTDPAVINLPDVSTRTTPLWIKNVGPTNARIVPFGTNTIDGLLDHWTLAAKTGPSCTTIELAPDTGGLSTWWILSAHNQESS